MENQYDSSIRPLVNTLVSGLSSSNLLPSSLDWDDLVSAAIRYARSDDFGGDDWKEPLSLLIEGYESSANLTELGRVVARRLVLGMLTNRLRTSRKFKESADLPKVEKPIFILGLPRTGSTLLHELLDVHPGLQTPKLWQADSVPEENWSDWLRIFKSFLRTKLVDVISPGFKSIHRLGALLPHECVTIQGLSFRSMQFHAIHRVDAYHEWLSACDWRPAYLWHERYLKILASENPGKRWLLKAPGHMLGISALRKQYPDAKFIQLHRRPSEVIPSMASLYASLRSGSSNKVDFEELGKSLVEEWRVGLTRVLDLRGSDFMVDQSCLDIDYQEMTGDPLMVVEKIAEFLELPLDPDTRFKMCEYLMRNRKGKHGSHRYSPEFFGLSIESIDTAFTDYIKAYNLNH